VLEKKDEKKDENEQSDKIVREMRAQEEEL